MAKPNKNAGNEPADKEVNNADDAAATAKADEATAEIKAAFDSSIANGKEEDDIKMTMIGAGASFKNVTRLFNQFMIDAGLAISKEDRDAAVTSAVTGLAFETEDEFNAAVKAVLESVKGATERSASGLVRAYAKKNELPVFTKPKGAGGGKSGFARKFYDALIANPKMTKEQATAFIQGKDGNEETSENVKRHESHYLGIHEMVLAIASK
jgi:hypothetical protein